MNPYLARIHESLRRTLRTKEGATHKAEDVPRGTHKAYPRMKRIELPAPQRIETTLIEALRSRESATTGNPGAPFTTETLGTLFGLAFGKHADTHKRHYPSGGALYPIETYFITNAFKDEEPGVFHYNPSLHALERLWGLPADFDMKQLAPKPESLSLSGLIVFTAVWARSSAKYGDLAYQHALIESGHMSQNALLASTALNLNARPYAGFNDTLLARVLDLDETSEQTVHTITLCGN